MFPITRRRFLAAPAAACAAAAAGRVLDAPAADARTAREIDTHTHFYDPTRPEGVPWPGKDSDLYRRALPAEWLGQAKPAGVTETVAVEASPWVEDNQWLLDLALEHPSIVGVIGNLSIGTEGCTRLIDRFAANPKFRGVRLGGQLVATGLDDAAFMRDIERLAHHGLMPDVVGGPVLDASARLAARLPEMQVVVEHMAGATFEGDEPNPEWAEGLARAAARQNTWLKVSHLVESAARATKQPRAPVDPDFYLPWLDAAWKAFGPDRLIFGSNWPVSSWAADYATIVGILRPWIAAHGAAAEASFFHAAARTAYGLAAAG